MTNKVEISNQAAEKLKEISEKAKKTIDELIVWLADNYPDAITSNDETALENDVTWTDEELDELLKPKKALTGKEIVEGGFISGWEHMNIDDPVVFLERQRVNRKKNKFSW
jgi:hypothetical protein